MWSNTVVSSSLFFFNSIFKDVTWLTKITYFVLSFCLVDKKKWVHIWRKNNNIVIPRFFLDSWTSFVLQFQPIYSSAIFRSIISKDRHICLFIFAEHDSNQKSIISIIMSVCIIFSGVLLDIISVYVFIYFFIFYYKSYI